LTFVKDLRFPLCDAATLSHSPLRRVASLPVLFLGSRLL
jgi:hypothetical protein